jgi:hypothetical protein
MAVRVDTSEAPALVRYTFDGVWSVQELLAWRHQLIEAGQLTLTSAVLFDLRPTSLSPAIIDLRRELPAAGVWPVCRAFVVQTETQYEFARQLQAMLGAQSVVSEIFRDETKALEWLGAIAGWHIQVP